MSPTLGTTIHQHSQFVCHAWGTTADRCSHDPFLTLVIHTDSCPRPDIGYGYAASLLARPYPRRRRPLCLPGGGISGGPATHHAGDLAVHPRARCPADGAAQIHG